MPFGPPFDGYYEQIIKSVANDLGRRAVRSDELYGIGAIVAGIWAQIWRAAVVIADVTGKKSNRVPDCTLRPVPAYDLTIGGINGAAHKNAVR